MFIINLIEYLKGYVIIQVNGNFLERFINVCIRRSLFVREIKILGTTRMTAKMAISSFKRIRPVALKTKSQIKITKKCGIPFIIHRHKKRRMVLVGIVLFFAILWYCANFVTGVEISGNVKISNEVLIKSLSELGAGVGERVNSIDTTLLQNQMMSKIPDLSWVGINKHGSKLYVEVKERTQMPLNIDRHIPCNVIANRNGIIVDMSVEYGDAVIKVGDPVLKDDLLVSGILQSSILGLRYVHSSANILAKTWYEKDASIPLEYECRENTGREVSRFSINILGYNLNLFINDRIPYTLYEKIRETRELKLLTIFPTINLQTEHYFEQTSQVMTRSVQEATAILMEQLKDEIEAQISNDAQKKEFVFSHKLSQDYSTVHAHAIYYALENIAKEVMIETEN